MNEYYQKFPVHFDQSTIIREWLQIQFQRNDGIPDEIRKELLLAVNEIFLNFVKHSKLTQNDFIGITSLFQANTVKISFEENSQGFDLTSTNEPNLDILNESGIGLFLVNNLMDEVEFIPHRANSENNKTTILKRY